MTPSTLFPSLRLPFKARILRFRSIVNEEVSGVHPRLLAAQMVCRVLPPFSGSRVRRVALRAAGFLIGRETVIFGAVRITSGESPYRNLTVGKSCWINGGSWFDVSGTISIGDRVSIGHEVLILTSTHDVAGGEGRAGDVAIAPVVIEDGAWLGARCVLLPGVRIGKGAVVAAGAIVAESVTAHTLVGGVPARAIRELTEDWRRPA